MSKIFNLYLNSAQKQLRGNNNDATYLIDWSATLPPHATCRCSFCSTQTGSNVSINDGNFENRPSLLYFNPGCNSNCLYNSTSQIFKNCMNVVGLLY